MREMQNGNQLDYTREHDACGIGAVVHIDGHQDYSVVDQALAIVEKLEHRAGKDASGEVGDGVGILLQVSHHFFYKKAKELGIQLSIAGDYGVGMFFFPQDPLKRHHAMKLFERIANKEGGQFLGWREVPCQKEILGKKANECMPSIYQCFIEKPKTCQQGLPFERLLYVIRREFEKSCPETYISSLSSQTIVYKGMFLVDQLRLFYNDLQDQDYHSAIALVHSRFSTNTTPSWQRAHPNRFIAHNGEINTIKGNVDRMLAREETLHSTYFQKDLSKIFPIVDTQGSDSAMLDNTLEFLYMNGMDIAKALLMLIPEPWKNQAMPQNKKDFYHYYATMMEPWDGPAAILFSDGIKMGALLDRNGLRPARYYLLDDQTLILSSEVGVLDIDETHIIKKARLEPGKILLVDTQKQELIEDNQCKMDFANEHSYGEWLNYYVMHLSDLPAPDKKIRIHSQKQRDVLYKTFGYTYEDVKDQILPMAQNNVEPIASMGTDIPLALMSHTHPSLFHYFKQQFAQVTNPPIDSLREEVVVDTTVYLGSHGNLLVNQPQNCRVIEINNPILDGRDIEKLKSIDKPGFKSHVISLLFYKGTSLKEAIDHLCLEVDKAIYQGVNILILSDRGIDENHLIIPSLLAVSALESHLVKTKKRTAVSLVLESGEPRDVHQFACLLGFGASAIYPYLAHECIMEMISLDMLDKEENRAIESYNHAILKGVVKIAAKMGISTLQSYQSAQIFETIGLSKEFMSEYFPHTTYHIGKLGIEDIEKDVRYHHDHAFDLLGLKLDTSLDSLGFHKFRRGEQKEKHLYTPETIILLQKATQTGNYALFKQYTKQLIKEQTFSIRHLLSFDTSQCTPISIDEVESVESIVKRFKTGAMSYGSISKEAHECLAIAMNRLGGKSNSGEGGEDRERLYSEANSAIKQVASGRFGVTSEYLVSAKEIQIKMAQGAKPGEGGHLPGGKVYPWIAKTRYSTPGVTLISPPPHHDIYSIEDLAQLIYDLKNANDQARISVKLVSESGVGTIASGVAKAGADVILISGYDGGTGAAPQSSIHHAGLPWELGLIEAHQNLIENGLRSQVVLETDGKLMSGKDVAIAALLGAEEFGFATAPLVSLGCMMMRVCHLDTCPAGIATQNECLRKRFKGKPEYVMNFMRFVAMELREIMAELGFKTVNEMVGQRQCLKINENLQDHQMIELDKLFSPCSLNVYHQSNIHSIPQNQTLDKSVLLPHFLPYFKKYLPHQETISISSLNRSVGTLLGSEMTRMFKGQIQDDMYQVHCYGGAGQSFGAFVPKGLTMTIEGDANDYFGKGLSGGKLAIFPCKQANYTAKDNVIIGNVALYGATSGEAYICGQAGERFAVRNSGVIAVVEGCGDHGLEYMTGGKVLVLGKTGKNFAAGMSGGIAYVLDEDHDLYLRLNDELVMMSELNDISDQEDVKNLLKKHIKATSSKLARDILDDFDNKKKHFKKVIPIDYAHILELVEMEQKQGYQQDEAALRAFLKVHKGG